MSGEKGGSKMKKWLSLFSVFLISLTLCSCGNASSDEKNAAQSSNLMVGEETILDFYTILEQVGIDKNDIGEVTKVEDWRLGPAYSFSLYDSTLEVHCNPDGTVQTLGLGLDVDFYKLGYEPWTIDNFIVDPYIKSAAIEKTKELVKACLDFPAAADFPWLDWAVGRSFNWYEVSSHVTAKNAFGVESEIPFRTIFWVNDDSIKPIYLEVNLQIIRDERAAYPLPERKEVAVSAQPSENGTIHIVDGQLGDYGKKVQLDSQEYDWYMVPAGKYKAVSNVKTCTIYIDKNEITRNSSGYVEMQNVATHTWSYGETIEINVGEDEHLFNVYGADYTLTPMS